MRATTLALIAVCLFGVSACGGDDDDTMNNDSTGDQKQTPPTSGAKLTTWLAKGYYKQWHCEDAVHEARSPSPHGYNRICSNDLIADNATGTGAWPKGAAAVKELYNAETDATPGGYSVYLKTDSDSKDGANFYWYEMLPPESPIAGMFPGGVAADGMGDKGNPKDLCVGCHGAAGSDTAHTPSPGGRDQVYTPVGG